ncbi:MAG: hypothetical protein KatS3mg060_1475 [Dehalococcoidia bacterium]|nr:MAG: hypothetical protein KatS3mg060_1475 [Dehalococcoidia bacterium]
MPRPFLPPLARLTVLAAGACGIALFVLQVASAAPGDLDSSFGQRGVVALAGLGWSEANAVAILPNGELLVAGRAGEGNLLIARLRPDGQPDPTFGQNGILSRSVGSGSVAYDAAVQADGAILVAGSAGDDAFIARFHPNGDPDLSFGDAGVVRRRWGSPARAKRLAVQPDGKIVMVGDSSEATGSQVLVARFLPNGAPDVAFGTDGAFQSALGRQFAYGFDLALLPDGRIVAAGSAIVRLTPTGTLDLAFGQNGVVAEPASGIVAQPDGTAIVVNSGGGVRRLTPAGVVDQQFGNGGGVTATLPGTAISFQDVAFEPDGRIVAVGFAVERSGRSSALLAALTPAGMFDTKVGSSGIVTHGLGAASANANGVAIQPDGKAAVAAAIGGAADRQAVVVRFDLGVTPATTPTLPASQQATGTPSSTAPPLPSPTPTLMVAATPSPTAPAPSAAPSFTASASPTAAAATATPTATGSPRAADPTATPGTVSPTPPRRAAP